jgi:hypothetical protein
MAAQTRFISSPTSGRPSASGRSLPIRARQLPRPARLPAGSHARRNRFGWRLLGRQQVLGYYEERKSKNHVYNFRDALDFGQPDLCARRPAEGKSALDQRLSWHRPPQPGPTSSTISATPTARMSTSLPRVRRTATYDFTWYNAQTKQWVTDVATFGTAAVAEASAGENANSLLNLLQTKGSHHPELVLRQPPRYHLRPSLRSDGLQAPEPGRPHAQRNRLRF